MLLHQQALQIAVAVSQVLACLALECCQDDHDDKPTRMAKNSYLTIYGQLHATMQQLRSASRPQSQLGGSCAFRTRTPVTFIFVKKHWVASCLGLFSCSLNVTMVRLLYCDMSVVLAVACDAVI